MSRSKKKDQNRKRRERATKKWMQREARRQARREARERRAEERRTTGRTPPQRSKWNELFEGPLTRRALAWCVLGRLTSMALIFVLVLPAPLLSGSRSAPPIFGYVMLLFLPSFFGIFVFAYLDNVLDGGIYGRGQDLHEPLNLSSNFGRTVKIKAHTSDVLTLSPVRAFQVASCGDEHREPVEGDGVRGLPRLSKVCS